MNATIIYAELCRQVISLESTVSDAILENIMKGDMGLCKLRNLLLCRFCRKISRDYLCSKLCSHLICNICFDEGVYCTFGCKWCRSKEDFVPDKQTSLLVEMFKQLCAILKDVITGAMAVNGVSELKTAFLDYVLQGFETLETVVVPLKKENTDVSSKETAREVNIESTPQETVKNKFEDILVVEQASNTVESFCQTDPLPIPVCSSCSNNQKNLSEDLSNNPVAVTPAESSDAISTVKKLEDSSVQTIDYVTSTVPDKSPMCNRTLPTSMNEAADTYSNGKILEPNDYVGNEKLHNDIIQPESYFEPLPNFSLKRVRKKQNIFEKYGLALSPPPVNNNSNESKINDTDNEHRHMPLKLKMKKVNSNNSEDSTYLVYDYSHKSDNSDSGCNEVQQSKSKRKVKRKATFISDYSIFSDDSDFEIYDRNYRKNKSSLNQKLDRHACACGSGGKVKYFTDICKRSRCPCYSQKRACVNCKCKFCSNPYIVEEEEEEVIYSESDNDSYIDGDNNIRFRNDNDFVDVEGV